MCGCFKNSFSAATDNSMSISRFICIVVILFIAGKSYAQSSIKASVNKNRILIGEPIELTVEANLPVKGKVFSIDTIPHFEMLGQPVIDTPIVEGNTRPFKGVYTITSFDSGRWSIPSFTLARNIKTDTIPIAVVFTENFDPTQQYHDIKDIIEVDITRKKFSWWWYAAGGAVLIAIIIYLLRRKKPVKEVKPKILVSPYEEAMKGLEELKRTKPETKLYYSKLTDIFRLYIYRKKDILSLQKTTDDLVLQLKGLNLPKEQFDKLSQSLRLSDFVKFAKYVPSENDDRDIMSAIESAIKTIEQPVAP